MRPLKTLNIPEYFRALALIWDGGTGVPSPLEYRFCSLTKSANSFAVIILF